MKSTLTTFTSGLMIAGAAMFAGSAAIADGYKAGPKKEAYEQSQGYDWGGLYIGVNAGWIGSDVGWTYRDPAGVVADRPISSASTDSLILGGHIGFQHQIGRLVLGVEGSWSGVGSDESFGSRPCFNTAFNCLSRHDGLIMTLGGRLGYTPRDNMLLYLTGGYAKASVETHEVLVATGVRSPFSTRDWHDGWYIGAGIEYALTKNWIIGLEYIHMDFDDHLHLSALSPATESRNISLESDVVRARLTFKLNRPEAAHESLK